MPNDPNQAISDAALDCLQATAVLPMQLAGAIRLPSRKALLRARQTLSEAALILDRALVGPEPIKPPPTPLINSSVQV